MKQLHLNVGSTVEIIRPCYLSANEVNTVECVFDLPAEYEGLIVKAQFTNIKPVAQLVVDGKCNVPPEALAKSGELEIGVIAYALDGEELIQRFSPTPAVHRVHDGSFDESAEEGGAVAPTVFEQQVAQMQKIVESAADDIAEKAEEKLNGDLEKMISFPTDENGKILTGEAGQLLVSNGDGTTSWQNVIDALPKWERGSY